MTLSPTAKKLLGIFGILIVVAIIISLQKPVDLHIPTNTSISSSSTAGVPSSLPVLADRMPEFQGITRWWNTPGDAPLTPDLLKGKVVIIDFWTYSCINCIRTQPVLRAWDQTYAKDGLVIVGVHTPEFSFEKDPSNVDAAIKQAGLKYPIALDPNYGTWTAYNNNSWPAEYIFDRQGRLRHVHFGEGEYDQTEQIIRDLLAEGAPVHEAMTKVDSTPDFNMIHTPETYFGLARRESLANMVSENSGMFTTSLVASLDQNFWTIGGSWDQNNERILAGQNAVFRMNVDTNAMHIVLGSSDGQMKQVRVLVDGKDLTDEELTTSTKRDQDGHAIIAVGQKALYRIARFPKGGSHLVELQLDPGIEMYAATFGE